METSSLFMDYSPLFKEVKIVKDSTAECNWHALQKGANRPHFRFMLCSQFFSGRMTILFCLNKGTSTRLRLVSRPISAGASSESANTLKVLSLLKV